jgi:hypothetical protein
MWCLLDWAQSEKKKMLAGLAEQGSTESISVVQDFRFIRNKGSGSRLEETGDFVGVVFWNIGAYAPFI